MAFGSFILVIDGERQDGTAEKKARLHLRSQGVDTLVDADADQFRFPTQFAKSDGVAISLPYMLSLDTDSVSGESTSIGYEGYVKTDEGQVDFQIAAQEAGTTRALADLTDEVAVPISTIQVYRDEAEAAQLAAEAAQAAAEAVGSTNDTIIASRVNDTASATTAALAATYGTAQDALRPTDRRYEQPPKMHAQANAAGHGWVAGSGNTATLTLNDTTYAPLGTQSIKLVSNGTFGAARIDKTGLALDLSGRSPVLWVSVDDVSKLNNMSLYLGNSGLSSNWLWQFAPSIAGVKEMQNGQLVKITLNWGNATVTGTPNRAAIDTVRFFFQDTNTGAAATVRFLGFGSQPEPTTRYPSGVVVFTCDDARATQWSVMKPALDKYGWPATAYVIAERVDSGAGWLTTAQLQSMQRDSKWEIGSHAYATAVHDQVGGFTGSTNAALNDDMRKLKRWLADRGFKGGDHVAYPQGLYNAAVLDTTREWFTSGRTIFGKGEIDDTWPPADPYRVRSAVLTSGAEATLAKMQAHVDDAVANKGLLVITIHELGAVADSLTWVSSDFDSLLSYISTSGAAVRTMGAALRGD